MNVFLHNNHFPVCLKLNMNVLLSHLVSINIIIQFVCDGKMEPLLFFLIGFFSVGKKQACFNMW